MKNCEINLEDYRAKDAKIFTGRDMGRSVRKRSNIDQIESQCDLIKFIIPDNIYSINPSFFEELLLNVVTKLGKDKFLEKFEFISLGEYNYRKPLLESIDRILRDKIAL